MRGGELQLEPIQAEPLEDSEGTDEIENDEDEDGTLIELAVDEEAEYEEERNGAEEDEEDTIEDDN